MSSSRNGKIVPPTPEALRKAAEILQAGGLVAFPTETVYGLGANGLDANAVRKIFAAKGRPQDNPLILHIASIRDAGRYAEVNGTAEMLMQQFWPGPLTIVLYAFDVVPAVTRADLDTVGLRMPLNAVALELIRLTGLPLAAPSANRSGRPSPTTAAAVWEDLGDAVDLIIDGGATAIGLESTVVDATEGAVSILRPGGVTREMLAPLVDLTAEGNGRESRSPGTRHRHYAPSVPLLLWKRSEADLDPSARAEVFEQVKGTSWAYIGLTAPPDGASPPCRCEILDSPEAYGQALFSQLRELESSGAQWIVAELPPAQGLGAALRNRLLRAAGEK